MADKQFEHKVSEQLSDFRLKPSAEVWQHVETQLQEDRRRRRWFFILPAAALLVGALLYAVWPDGAATEKEHVTTVAKSTADESNKPLPPLTDKTSSNDQTETNSSVNEQPTENKIASSSNEIPPAPVVTNDHVLKQQVQRNKQILPAVKKKSKQIVDGKHAQETIVSVQTEPPAANETVTDKIAVVDDKKDSSNAVVNNSAHIITDTVATETSVDVDSAVAATQPVVAVKKKWQLGVHANIGVSDIRKKLFPGSGFKSAADMMYSPIFNNGGGQGGATRIVRYDYAIDPSVQFGVGIVARKPFKKKHAFVTGLQYQYNSYKVTQREQVDSFIQVTNLFNRVSTKERSAMFTMHAVNVPLEIELTIAAIKKNKLLFNAGIHNWFIIASAETDTLSSFPYSSARNAQTGGLPAMSSPIIKPYIYQPQLSIAPAFEWSGKRTSSQIGIYLNYALRPAYHAREKDYWWQTGIRYRLFFNR
ncbi:MAG: PorT family protein [Chitinophagaceae bacterium]|nr:PorT family protein [Chitinophagaceae bacterium]